MEIKNTQAQAVTQGIQANAFGFARNSKMYDIVMSKMYTNKPGAVIRELASNAWDGHVAAGNTDTPFEIQLPTWLDKSFYLRDYGTGIPHDKFEEIYTNVGASTKENSNDFIGGFGLGSKTPFTMTDTFMVENWYGGIKTTWMCFKDAGVPSVAKVAEEPSSEPSGVKVSFSFDSNDVSEFTKQVTKQLKFFPVKPVITGGEGKVEFDKLPAGWDTKEYFFINDTSRYSAPCYVVMGNVSYSLNPSDFGYQHGAIFENGIVIKVPIGAVDIPPSREHLELTPKTKAYIEEVLVRVRKNYAREAQLGLDACKTDWEARCYLFDVNRSLVSVSDLVWKGVITRDYFSSRVTSSHLSHLEGLTIKTIQKRYANPYRTGSINMRSAIDGKLEYYVNDLGPGGVAFIREEHSNHDTNNWVVFHVDYVKKTFETDVKDTVNLVQKTIGVVPKLLSSVLGKPPVKQKGATVTNRAEPNQVFSIVTPSKNSDFKFKEHTLVVSDLPKDSYYIELSGGSFVTDISYIKELIEGGLVSVLDKPLYAVRKKTIPKLDKSMVLLTPTVLAMFRKKIQRNIEITKQYEDNVVNVHYIKPELMPLLSLVKDRDVHIYTRYCSLVLKSKTVDNGIRWSSLYTYLYGGRYNVPPVVVKPRLKQLRDNYEQYADLFRCLHSYQESVVKARINLLTKMLTK